MKPWAFLIGIFQPVNGEPAAVTEDLHHTKAVCFRSSGLKINQGTAVGNVFYENPIKETGEILKFFHSSTVPVMLVEKDRMYINFINNDVVQAHEAISTPLPIIMEYTGNTIYQAIFYVKKAEQSKITGCLKNVEIMRWNDGAVDVVEKGGSKVTGIQKYLSIKEYTREEAAAFGDGENDIEMLRYVQEGIAMGNANDFVKSIADYVTADIDDNGIEKGLRYLGLL